MKGFSPWPGRVSAIYLQCETVEVQFASPASMWKWSKIVIERHRDNLEQYDLKF